MRVPGRCARTHARTHTHMQTPPHRTAIAQHYRHTSLSSPSHLDSAYDLAGRETLAGCFGGGMVDVVTACVFLLHIFQHFTACARKCLRPGRTENTTANQKAKTPDRRESRRYNETNTPPKLSTYLVKLVSGSGTSSLWWGVSFSVGVLFRTS